MNSDELVRRAVNAAYFELRRQADENNGFLAGRGGGEVVLDGYFDLPAVVRAVIAEVRRDD